MAADLTQLNVTIADYHGLVADFHQVINGLDLAVAGFSDSAASAVSDRDKSVRDEVDKSVASAVSSMREHLTKARSVLTALQAAQVTGHHGRVAGHHRAGEPLPIGATVTADSELDEPTDADATGDRRPERTEIHERRPSAEPAGTDDRDEILTGDTESGGHEHSLASAKAVFPAEKSAAAKDTGTDKPAAKA